MSGGATDCSAACRHLLCVLLLCLVSLLHLARLFENQTFTRQSSYLSGREMKRVIASERLWWTEMMSLPWLFPRGVWSGLTASLWWTCLHTGCWRTLSQETEARIWVFMWCFVDVKHAQMLFFFVIEVGFLPCSSALLCSWVNVVRLRCCPPLGFWSLMHTVSDSFLWLISSWIRDSKSTQIGDTVTGWWCLNASLWEGFCSCREPTFL